MATENNTLLAASDGRATLEKLISEIGHGFAHVPATKKDLMFVPKDLDKQQAQQAEWKSETLVSCVQSMLEDGVQNDLDANACYVLAFALDAATALRSAVNTSRYIARKERDATVSAELGKDRHG